MTGLIKDLKTRIIAVEIAKAFIHTPSNCSDEHSTGYFYSV